MLNYMLVIGVYEVISTLAFLILLGHSSVFRYALRNLIDRLEGADDASIEEEEEYWEELEEEEEFERLSNEKQGEYL